MQIKPSIKIAIVLAILFHLIVFLAFKGFYSSEKSATTKEPEPVKEVVIKVPEPTAIPATKVEVKQPAELRLEPITVYSTKPNLSEEIKKDLDRIVKDKINEIDVDEALRDQVKDAPKDMPKEAQKPTTPSSETEVIKIVQGYHQAIGEHLEKHKEFPKEALEGRLNGDALIWMKVAKDGRILEFELKERTPYKILNQSISDMITKSNPLPAFPAGYPAEEFDEFTFPVHINYEKF